MKSILMAVMLAIAAGTHAAEPIVLVRGTVSAPNTAERNYAARLTVLFERWLTDIGIPHATIDDEKVAGSLESARLVILCYNPNPPAPQLAALRQFVERGGKLMVFYSSSPDLAALMHMRLGDYMSAPLGGRWSRFTFNTSAPPHVPDAVIQESRNIRPVYPAASTAKIIARWTNGSEQAFEPAWVQSGRGLWMSHVLLNDGDSRRKKQMLLALIAACVPDVWQHAAGRSIESVCRFGDVEGFGPIVDRIRNEMEGRRGLREIGDLIARAGTLHRRLPQMMAEHRYVEAVSSARRIDRLVIEAFARTQESGPGELRGIWDHTGTGLYPRDWKETCRILASNGVTDIFSNMAWPGIAHYPSRAVSQSVIAARRGDQLAQCVAAAREARLRVHVWKVCWNLSKAPESFVSRMRKEGRLQVSDTGAHLKWLCPSNTENLKMEKDTIREIAGNYDIDGIHLDYIRYPDSHACYCPVCRRNFEKSLGREVPNWPAHARSAPLKDRYRSWREEQITRMVRDIRAFLKKEHPSVKLSAAVYGRYPLCAASVGQDWGSWLRDNLVDFVCPMNYTEDLARFETLVEMQTRLPSAAGRIIPGIGVTAAESNLNAFQVIEQIRALRKEGAAGYLLFDLNRHTEEEILPYLRMGIAR